MKIAITGGSGRVGKAVVRELNRGGHDIFVFDMKNPVEKDTKFIKGNMLNINDCRKALENIEIIVHLGAIPNLNFYSSEVVFNNNVTGTFNLYKAATDAGIKKIVQASSNVIYGLYPGDAPLYLPIDEEHPVRPASDGYTLSKKVCEEIAQNFARQYGLSTALMRIAVVVCPESMEEFRHFLFTREWWMYVCVEDVAQAFRLAVEAEGLKKIEAFNISAADNGTELDSLDLIKKEWGDNVIYLKKDIKGRETLYDYTKAKFYLGYEPKFSWKDFVKGGNHV